MTDKNRKIDIGLILLFVLLLSVMSQSGMMKYIVVLAVSLIFLIAIRFKITKADVYILIPPLAYICFGLLACLTNGYFSSYTVKWMLLLLIPPVASIAIFEFARNRNEDAAVYVFWGIVAADIPLLLHASSGDLAESQYAFIFGVYLLYFFYKRKWSYWCLCLALLILAHKRIATAAAAASMALLVFLLILKRPRYRKCMTAVIFIAIVLISQLYIWMTDSRLFFIICEELELNTNGRAKMWAKFAEYYSYSAWFTGNGTGWVLDKLEAIHNSSFANLHNDLLTAYIEIGFAGYFCWILSHMYMAVNLSKKTDSLAMCFFAAAICYTIIIYFTDNTLIYINYWLPLNILLLNTADGKPGSCRAIIEMRD